VRDIAEIIDIIASVSIAHELDECRDRWTGSAADEPFLHLVDLAKPQPETRTARRQFGNWQISKAIAFPNGMRRNSTLRLLAGDIMTWRGIIMKPSIIAFMLLASTTLVLLAQELSVEDRACIKVPSASYPNSPRIRLRKAVPSRAVS
jgi:hypothetical protein